MNVIFRRILLILALFSINPTQTKQMGRATTTPIVQPTPPAPIQPIQPIIKPAPVPVQPAPAPIQPPVQPAPQPTPGHNAWTSSAGLVYKSSKTFPNRINHVLAHAKADPTKKNHSVFSVPEDQILDLVDEAWSNRGNPRPNPKGNGDIYTINMGRVIGTKGETKIQINTFQGTSEVISAYPVQ
jgi:hypothetical protein